MAHTGQLVELVLTWIGDPEGTRYHVGAIGQHLAEAQNVFLRETNTILRDEATLAETADSPERAFYGLPSDFFQADSLTVNGQPLEEKNEAELARYYGDWRTATGTPRFFVLYRGKARLVPIPDETAEPVLAYVKRAGNPMVSQEPDLDPIYHIPLAHYAAAWILVHDDTLTDPAKANYHQGEFRTALESALGPAAHRQSRGYRTVGRRWFR